MSSDQPYLSPQFNVLLMRYGEIALKSQQVRKRMLRNLLRNIRFQCTRDGVKFSRLWRDHGFIYLHPKPGHIKTAISTLQKVLGIQTISPVIYTKGGLEIAQQTALNLAKEVMEKNNTFGIRARRIGNHTFSSGDVAKSAGALIMEELGSKLNLKVNLSQPDKWIHVQIRDKNIFVYSESINTIWGGNALEPSSAGGFALIDGHISEFVSAMMVMRRGMYIFPVVFTKDSEKSQIIHEQIAGLKNYLPIRSLYYFRMDTTSIKSHILQIIEQYNYPPLGYALYRKFRLLLGEWLIKHHQSLFQLLETNQRIDWNSNIASHLSNKQQKSDSMGKRRKLKKYVSIIEGNYPFSYYTTKIPLFKNIESSYSPIFRAAIAFTPEEIEERFNTIHTKNAEVLNSLKDLPEIKDTEIVDEKLYPIPPKSIDKVPDVLLNDFNTIWESLKSELESYLRDHGLLGEPTIRSLESFEIIQI